MPIDLLETTPQSGRDLLEGQEITPETPTEMMPAHTPDFDLQRTTKTILDRFNAGDYSPEQVTAFDELKRRGMFEGPMSVASLSSDVQPVDDEKTTLKDVGGYITETISNIPESGKKAASELFHAVTNPQETKNLISGLMTGAAQKLYPGEQEQEKYADALISGMIDRYGSPDAALETIKKDPAGVAGDIASLLSGVGTALRTTKFGQMLQRTGAAVEPLTPIAKGVKKVVEKTPQFLSGAKTPADLYQSAVKFSTTLPEPKRAALADTALKSGIMPTYEGLNKIWDNINNLNEQIANKIDVAAESGKTLNIDDLFKGFEKIEKDALLTAKPKDRIAAIKGIKEQIKEVNEKIGREKLTPPEAQKLKQNIYKDIQEYYEKRLKEPLSIKAQKTVARNAKEFLEEVIPGIKELNKKDSDLIALLNALDRPVSRIANRDIIGIGTPIKTGAGFGVGAAIGEPMLGTAIGVTMGVLDHPRVKARLAIVLDKMEDLNIDPGPDAMALMNTLYETRKIEEQE